MIAFTAVSGAMIYIVIVAVTVGMLRQGLKRKTFVNYNYLIYIYKIHNTVINNMANSVK